MAEVEGDLDVRSATPGDAQSVTALLHASYPALLAAAYPPEVLRWALPATTQANPKLLSSGRYFLAFSGERLVGCGGWSWQQPGTGQLTPGLGHLRHFATHPDWLRRGVGRAVYRRSEAQALAEGARRLECFSSLNAEPFYRALGFHRVRLAELTHGDAMGMTCVLMRRDLKPAGASATPQNAAGIEPV